MPASGTASRRRPPRFQWRRGTADIAGATGASYTPVAADDRAALTCRVTASNAAGSQSATTAAVQVSYPAPVASGTLPDLDLTLGAPAGSVAAGAAFTGAGLSFAVSGAGATIDAATGAVSIPTSALLAATTVTVTATNSGGSASVELQGQRRGGAVRPDRRPRRAERPTSRRSRWPHPSFRAGSTRAPTRR